MFDLIDDPGEIQLIHDSLAPLYDRAEKEQLWFYQRNQGMWFTPAELRELQSKGRWVWGATNWELRDPNEELARLYLVATNARKGHDLWQLKMNINGVMTYPF